MERSLCAGLFASLFESLFASLFASLFVGLQLIGGCDQKSANLPKGKSKPATKAMPQKQSDLAGRLGQTTIARIGSRVQTEFSPLAKNWSQENP